MNNERIILWVDELFSNFTQTSQVMEQKEELQQHMLDKIKEYMANGMNFDQAFEAAKDSIGDTNELLANFSETFQSQTFEEGYEMEDEDCHNCSWHFRLNKDGIVALSPFVYLLMGFAFGWWAWGWIVIPVSAIIFSSGLFSKSGRFGDGIVALSPFVYLLMGFVFGWWAWGWIIIPVSAVLFCTPLVKSGRR